MKSPWDIFWEIYIDIVLQVTRLVILMEVILLVLSDEYNLTIILLFDEFTSSEQLSHELSNLQTRDYYSA